LLDFQQSINELNMDFNMKKSLKISSFARQYINVCVLTCYIYHLYCDWFIRIINILILQVFLIKFMISSINCTKAYCNTLESVPGPNQYEAMGVKFLTHRKQQLSPSMVWLPLGSLINTPQTWNGPFYNFQLLILHSLLACGYLYIFK
jgi:hypothetical protein